MRINRIKELLSAASGLRLAVVGDFCLDRYLEIDPGRQETSIETGLPVFNVERVRSQPGAAGTVLNNLVALGVHRIDPVGFCGEDGEGFELRRALEQLRGVAMDGFIQTPMRRTFTYCKPLLVAPGKPPVELNRLDSKNWTPTPDALSRQLATFVRALSAKVDAMIVMDQVDVVGTGAVCADVLDALGREDVRVPVVADSRSGLGRFPSMIFKMNRAELASMVAMPQKAGREDVLSAAEHLAEARGHAVFVTLSEDGMVGAEPGKRAEWVSSVPLRGPIDIVGAGDSVTASLTVALAAGASVSEAMQMAMLAASVTVHKLGTTGTASPDELLEIATQTLGD